MSFRETEKPAPISIRKGDVVQVMSGDEKGKSGKVLRVDPKSQRIVIEKIKMVKRHVRPSQTNPSGGYLEKEASLHVSNVLLFCPKCSAGRRHGTQLQEAGKKGEQKKVRVCKKCKEVLESA